MKPEDIQAYMDRDWARVRKLKERYWVEQKATMTPDEALAIADSLRRQAKALRPDWPSERERAEDLATHIRVSEALRSVSVTQGE
jgi:hypothetical protein